MTGNFSKDYLDFHRSRKCVACGADVFVSARFFSEVWKEDMSGKNSIYVCRSCGLAYTYPFLTISEENKLYADYFAHHIHENLLENKVDLRLKLQDRIDDFFSGLFFKNKSVCLKKLLSGFLFQRVLVCYPIYSHAGDGGLRILDIGCGDGHFLNRAKRFGCLCYATEYNDNVVKRLNDMGITATTRLDDFVASVEEGGPKFDIIRINWVLEHVIDPGETLEKARKLLDDKGELIIGVPSFDTPANIFKEYFQMHLPQHRQLFTKKSITRLLESRGFRAVYYKTKSMGAIAPSMARKYGLKNANFAMRLFDLVISVFLDLFNKGDAIEVYAKKKV